MSNLMRNIGCLAILSLYLILSINVQGSTTAYWQMDDWSVRTIFKDAVGSMDLVAHTGHQGIDDFVGANPIPNPDPGPFSEGDPNSNTRSNRAVRGNTTGPVTTFNMTSSGSWTFEGWFHRTGMDTGLLAGTRSMEEGTGDGWEIYHLADTGKIVFRMVQGSDILYTCDSGANVLLLNTWHHIALVWDHDTGTYGKVRLYIDGVLVGSVAATNVDDSAAKAFFIGGRDWLDDGQYKYTQWEFDGYMDELRFSSGVLAPHEFLDDAPPQPPNSVIYDFHPDFNWDCQTNFLDFSIFADEWLNEVNIVSGTCGDENNPYPKADLNLDCKVDFNDLAVFALAWLDYKDSGLDEIASLKSALWDSNDTDWANWVVVYSCPTRIYYDEWTDAERLSYVQDFDPDVVGLWAGPSLNRGEFLRMRGIAEVAAMEYEYQESIGPMNSFAEQFFTGNGIAIKEDGTVPLRYPWYVPYMSVIAPKWRNIVSQGIWRLAMYSDGIFQDNIAATLDGVGGGNFGTWENHFFKEYLKTHFNDAQLTWMGITDVDTYEIRTDLAAKRATMNNVELISDPVIHEYIRFNYLEHLKVWVEMAEKAKRTASGFGRRIPVMMGHLSGSWGTRTIGLALCDKVDLIRPEMSGLRQPCFYNEPQKQAESSVLHKLAHAAGHFELPVVTTQFGAINNYSDQIRVVDAVIHSEAQSNGSVSITDTYYMTEEASPRWEFHKRHAQFVSQNRHLFTDRTSVAKIALVESLPSLLWRDFSSIAVPLNHWDQLSAAARFLEDNHLIYDGLILGHPDLYDDSSNLDRLSDYDMIILPNVDCISDEQIEAISQYVTNGGTLVLWHEVGTYDEEMIARAEPAFDHLQSQPGLGQVKVISETLAEDYRLERDGSAENQILAIIEPNQPVVDTTLPETVWVNAWQYGAGPMKAVHMVNYDVDPTTDTVTAVSNFTLKLKCPNDVNYTSAYYYTPDYLSANPDLPAPQSLSLTRQNGYLQVQVPQLKIYGIVVFSDASELDARIAAAQLRKWYERLKLACRSAGQNIEDYSSILTQAESLLVQVQGDADVNDFASLVTPLTNTASQLEADLQSITSAVQTFQTTIQDETIDVNAVKKFDFSYPFAPVAPGWTPITSSITYSAARGYGWISISHYDVGSTGEPDDLHGDFMRSKDPADGASGYPGNNQFPYGDPNTHPVTFRVDLPNDVYVITLVSGDYSEMAMTVGGSANEGRVGSTYVDVNNGDINQPALYGDRLYSGYFQNRSFEVEVTKGFIEMTFWGQNVGPLYHNSIEWLINGLIIQTQDQALTADANEYLARAAVLSDGAIRDWSVIGPFDDDDCMGMEVGYGPEADPNQNLSWPGKGGTVSWQQIPTLIGTAPYVGLSNIFSDVNEVAAYVQTYVYCPQAVTAKLVYSISQSGIGWVNGIEVFRDEISAGLLLEEGVAEINFQPGWNSILIKSLNHWGFQWSVHASLLDDTNQPFINIPGVVISSTGGQ